MREMRAKIGKNTPEARKEGRQVWSAQRDTPGTQYRKTWHPERVPGILILAPFQGVSAHENYYQGLRSFHSLNPWLPSWHAPGVLLPARDL